MNLRNNNAYNSFWENQKWFVLCKFIIIIIWLTKTGLDNFYKTNINEKKIFYIINALNLNLQTKFKSHMKWLL